MRRWIILLFAFVLVTACNSGTKSNTQDDKERETDDKTGKDDQDSMNTKRSDKIGQYTWKKTEQSKFLQDCRREFEENVTKAKLEDFCSCILSAAQKYYPSYRHMDEKSNDEHDKEIFAECPGLSGDGDE